MSRMRFRALDTILPNSGTDVVAPCQLTHWGRVTHICVSKLTIIGSDNGLWPDRRQAIIWTIAGSLLIGPLGTNFSEILIEILTFSFKKMCLKVSSAKRRPFCFGLNVLNGARGLRCTIPCVFPLAFVFFVLQNFSQSLLTVVVEFKPKVKRYEGLHHTPRLD